jgi:hypothetical protein
MLGFFVLFFGFMLTLSVLLFVIVHKPEILEKYVKNFCKPIDDD